MSDFNPVEFVGNPSAEELASAAVTKDDLKYIATTFGITYTHNTTKSQLKSMLLKHLGDTEAYSLSPNMDPRALIEIEKIKLDTLKLKLDHEREEREREREHELRLLQARTSDSNTRSSQYKSEITICVKLLPSFTEANPEAFFREFEATASHYEIPEDDWIWLVKPKLHGKAVRVCEGIHDNAVHKDV